MSQNTTAAYRLVSPRWSSTAFSGESARKYGGRWNSPGFPVVYLSESRALCALELLVHLTTPGSRAKAYHLLETQIAEEQIETIPLGSLSPDWKSSPPTKDSTILGDRWLTEQRSLALRIPSSIIPEETNLLLNVNHPDFAKIKIGEPHTFSFDQRL